MRFLLKLFTVLCTVSAAPMQQSPLLDEIIVITHPHPCPNSDLEIAATPKATVALANEFTGSNARAQFSADGSANTIKSLYGTSVLAAPDGKVKASSTQLTQFPQGIVCVFKDRGGSTKAVLSSTVTFVSFGGVISLDGWTLKCSV